MVESEMRVQRHTEVLGALILFCLGKQTNKTKQLMLILKVSSICSIPSKPLVFSDELVKEFLENHSSVVA